MLEKIEKNIEIYSHLHGDRSLVVSYFTFLKLCYFLHNKCDISSYEIKEILKTLFYIYFNNEVSTNVKSEFLYHYNATNLELIEKSYKIHRRYIKNEFSYTPEHQFLYNRFIYVVSEDNQIRYYNKPMPQELLLSENRDILKYPTHPILAVEFDFSVKVAGEISFLWDENKNNPDIIFINNISGHFLPKFLSAKELFLLFKDMSFTNNSNIITLTNNGILLNGESVDYISL